MSSYSKNLATKIEYSELDLFLHKEWKSREGKAFMDFGTRLTDQRVKGIVFLTTISL